MFRENALGHEDLMNSTELNGELRYCVKLSRIGALITVESSHS